MSRSGAEAQPAEAPQPVVSAPRAPSTPFFSSQGATRAVPRESAPASPTASIATPGATARPGVPDNGQRVAQPRQRVPGPQDQQQAYAVPRGTAAPPPRPGSLPSADRVYPRTTTRVYNNYYYYPRQNYPYGYGSYGLGYFYYDPYAWYDSYPVYGSYPAYSSGIYQYPYGYPTGEIRLQVRPRHAEVYVDGYYAGRVDDFDGFIQALRIEEGPHTIEIVAPGYQPLVFNVRIIAGRKIDYRGSLVPY
jgi:hypothetical protein